MDTHWTYCSNQCVHGSHQCVHSYSISKRLHQFIYLMQCCCAYGGQKSTLKKDVLISVLLFSSEDNLIRSFDIWGI